MSGAHRRTEGEILAQRAKSERRYANFIGKGYCELTRKGRTCPDRSVRYVGDFWVCQHHSDLLDAIVADANHERRRHPVSRRKRAAA